MICSTESRPSATIGWRGRTTHAAWQIATCFDARLTLYGTLISSSLRSARVNRPRDPRLSPSFPVRVCVTVPVVLGLEGWLGVVFCFFSFFFFSIQDNSSLYSNWTWEIPPSLPPSSSVIKVPPLG